MSTNPLISIDKRRTAKTLSPEQVIEFKLKELKRLKMRILGEFSFGMIKSVADIISKTGFTPTGMGPETIVDKPLILHIFTRREEEIRAGTDNPTIPVTSSPAISNTTKPAPTEVVRERHTVDDYPPLPALKNNPRVRYTPFQNKAASQVIIKLCDEAKRGILLQAPVGSGKTYIYGAIIKTLWERGWSPLKNSFSPFPCVVVTKATIVEQTERVLADDFGLKIGTEVDVTNYDQLRSKFGEQFIDEQTKHHYGEVEIYYEWKPLMAPALIVWDEAQSLKNIESTQSKLAQAYNEIDDKFPTYQIFTSATPFTRIIESKCFVVSTRLDFH